MLCVHHRLMTMRLQRIEQFIAVADAGSIRGAARQLGMSQPALTRALQQLEKELGVALMRRSGLGVSITDAGTTFLARARVAQAEIQKATEEAQRNAQTGDRLLSIGLSPVGASLLLPELVIGLHREWPRTRVRLLEMTPSALLPLVRDEVMDLAVTQRTRIHIDAGLDYRPLADIQMRVAVRPGHPLLRKRTVSLKDLVDVSWLYMTAHDSADDIVSRSFLNAGLPIPKPSVHCGSYFVALDLMAATDMVGVLPPGLLRSCMKSGQLVELRLEVPLFPINLGLYLRAGSPPTPAAKMAQEMIAAQFKRLVKGGALIDNAPLKV
jgi:LysR family transcriptional regulator, regulator of abg operon